MDVIAHMNEAKKAAVSELSDVEVTPTVANAMNQFTNYLDTAYLWYTQLQYFIQQGGPVSEEQREAAITTQFPGATDGAEKD